MTNQVALCCFERVARPFHEEVIINYTKTTFKDLERNITSMYRYGTKANYKNFPKEGATQGTFTKHSSNSVHLFGKNVMLIYHEAHLHKSMKIGHINLI